MCGHGQHLERAEDLAIVILGTRAFFQKRRLTFVENGGAAQDAFNTQLWQPPYPYRPVNNHGQM
jgi:hypothetical protein